MMKRERDALWRDSMERDESQRREHKWAVRRDTGLALVSWLVLLGVGLWLLSHFTRPLLLLLVAALLAYALAPLVGRLARYLPRWLAILIVYVALLAVLAGFGTLVVQTAIGQISALVTKVQQLIAPGAHGAPSQMAQFLQRFGITQAQLTSQLQRLVGDATSVGGQVVPVLTGVANATLDTILVLVLSVYLVVDGARVSHWLRTSTPRRYRPRIASTLDIFQHVVGGYIRGQVALSALIGVLVTVVTLIAPPTRPFAILLGLVAFFFEFVPIIGTLVSGALCVLLALPGGIFWAAFVLVCFIGIHVIEGEVVGPRIVGGAVGLHPVVSIIALIAGAELFGIWGALFASPVAGVIQAIATDLYVEWRKDHPGEFEGDGERGASDAAKAAAETVADRLANTGIYRASDRRPAERGTNREQPSPRKEDDLAVEQKGPPPTA